MKQATLKLAAVALLIGGTNLVKAQSISDKTNNVVTTAVPMLRISPDARSTGMGETGIATGADAYSNFWNLGKTPFAKQKAAIGVTYTPWLNDLDLKDVYIASLAGYYKIDDNQALSLGLRYFSLGSIQFTSNTGEEIGSNNPREYTIEGGYSRKLGAKSGLGIGVRYISSNLANGPLNGVVYKKGSSVAADLHYYHNGAKENGEGFNYGVTLSNLGAKISYTDDNTQKDFIPANIGLGGAYTKVFDADSKLTFAVDFNKLLVPTPDTSAAGIANYRKQGVVSSWAKSLPPLFSICSRVIMFTSLPVSLNFLGYFVAVTVTSSKTFCTESFCANNGCINAIAARERIIFFMLIFRFKRLMNSKDELSANETQVEMKTVFCSKTIVISGLSPESSAIN